MESSKADPNKLAYIGGARKSNDWFTPDKYLDAVRQSFENGRISFDPMSSDIANERIQADEYLTEEDNALTASWGVHENTFMNPPYSSPICKQATTLFARKYLEGAFPEGIVLVNNTTETKAFQYMLTVASAICFTNHRIAFWNADNKNISNNTRGQTFLYFGKDSSRFRIAMRDIGFTTDLK